MEVTVNCILKDERRSILKFDRKYKVVYNETKKQTPRLQNAFGALELYATDPEKQR